MRALLFAIVAAAGLDAQLIEELRAHKQGTAVWWTGNAGWVIKSGGLTVATDLDLSAPNKVQPPPVTAEDLAAELDVAFVSHHHGDHCNVATIRALARGTRTVFVLPKTCLRRVESLGIPPDRIVVPEPLKPFEVKGVKVEPLHAIHGNQEFTVLTREKDFVESIASNCGYAFELGGKRFFHPGDSVLTEEHLALRNIDVLFVSPTVHNMHVDRSAILINKLQPAHIFPQHFGTFRETDDNRFWTRGYPEELRERLSADLQKRYHQLKQGQRFTIE